MSVGHVILLAVVTVCVLCAIGLFFSGCLLAIRSKARHEEFIRERNNILAILQRTSASIKDIKNASGRLTTTGRP